ILLASRPLKYLDAVELEKLLLYCKIASFPSGETFLYQGKKNDGMYIIISGNAHVSVKVLGKKIIELANLEQGNFIGEVALIQKELSTASVRANGPLECLIITTNYFDILSLFFPEIRYKIIKAITEEVCFRSNNLHKMITSFMSHSEMTKKSVFGK